MSTESPRADLSSIPVAVVSHAVPPDAELDDPSLYFNRELSWLDFNWRVLYQAMNRSAPLLERTRFLAIAQHNLDEFFGKRVGGLKAQVAAGVSELSPDGRQPGQQLDLVRDAVLLMQQQMTRTWTSDLRIALADEAGIMVEEWEELSIAEQTELAAHFRASIYPVLTPLAVDPGHPFPFISNGSLSLAITLRHPRRGTDHFARVKLPVSRGRWIRVGTEHRYVSLESLVARHVEELFRGMEVTGAHLFRITRSAELEREDDGAEDLLHMISEELRERRFAPVVRLEVSQTMPATVRDLLIDELELHPMDVYEVEGLIDMTSLSTIADLALPQHRFPHWEPIVPPALTRVGASDSETSIFDVIRNGDVLVHHPYESFAASVEHFVEAASVDPHVLAIKQTLYRMADDSRVARALIRAAEDGKQVAVLVEVTASLDEQRNIDWGQRMEKAGVHVTYGVVGLKTHTKITLVVREERDGIRSYCHIGTGNYNERTARVYTDIGFFTASPGISSDVVNLFHFLTGFSDNQSYNHLLVAPGDMRRGFIDLIEREIALGTDGCIIIKMNAIDDVGMIQALYRASRAGVRIDLIIRGHCRLRPGVPGFSDNIRVCSILGRFLEHDRIFYFHNGGEPQVFIGSADWRRRNLEERIEAMARIDAPVLQLRLRDILDGAFLDNVSAWDLQPDGEYVLRRPPEGEPACNYQERLMLEARGPERRVSSPSAR